MPILSKKRYEDMKIHNRRKHLLSLPNFKMYKTWFNSKQMDINTKDELQSMIGELEELQDISWEEINQRQSKNTQEKSTQTHTEFSAPDGLDYNDNQRIINEKDHLILPCEIHRGITTPTDDLNHPNRTRYYNRTLEKAASKLKNLYE